MKFEFYNTQKNEKYHKTYFYFINHASNLHALLLKNKLQKCIRKFCFSQWAFENSGKEIFISNEMRSGCLNIIYTVTKDTRCHFLYPFKETHIAYFLQRFRSVTYWKKFIYFFSFYQRKSDFVKGLTMKTIHQLLLFLKIF